MGIEGGGKARVGPGGDDAVVQHHHAGDAEGTGHVGRCVADGQHTPQPGDLVGEVVEAFNLVDAAACFDRSCREGTEIAKTGVLLSVLQRLQAPLPMAEHRTPVFQRGQGLAQRTGVPGESDASGFRFAGWWDQGEEGGGDGFIVVSIPISEPFLGRHVAEAVQIKIRVPVDEPHLREAARQQRDQSSFHQRCDLFDVAGCMGDEPDHPQLVAKVSGTRKDQQAGTGSEWSRPDGSIHCCLAFDTCSEDFSGFSVIAGTFKTIAAVAKNLPVFCADRRPGAIGKSTGLPIVHGLNVISAVQVLSKASPQWIF